MKKTDRIMRKGLALLLFLAMLVSCCAAFAMPEGVTKPFSLDLFKQYETLFSVNEDQESGLAFVETQLAAADLSFTHKYESETMYSFIMNDVVVIDYFTDDPYPVFRTWINYCADEPQEIQSVTFVLDGKSYTFTDVTVEGSPEQLEGGYRERLVIRYGANNWDFFGMVTPLATAYVLENENNDPPPKMQMILHGKEDIEADVPDIFWQDFAVLILPFFGEENWYYYIVDNGGNPCETAEVPAA